MLWVHILEIESDTELVIGGLAVYVAADVVEKLICKIGNNEFTVTPDYADLMYLEVLNKSKLQETPIELGNPDASLNISY